MKKNPAKRKSPHHVWKKAFLSVLAQLGNVSAAAKQAGVDNSTVYEARGRHPEFAAAWEEALQEAADMMEVEAYRRGISGVDEPVYGSGGAGVGTVQVGTIRRYSDTLLIFLLKAARPEKFRERYEVKHKGRVKQGVELLTDDQLNRLLSRGPGRKG